MAVRKKISIRLERHLWEALKKVAEEQTLLAGIRFPIMKALRTAIEVFLRLTPEEINQALERGPRKLHM